MMDYIFGLRGHDIADNFNDMCENAKNSGIKKLQFAMAKTVNDINFDEVGYNTEISAKIKKQLESHDLHVSVLGCYINPVDENEDSLNVQLERFKNFLYYAKDFGADVVGTETGWHPDIEVAHSEERYIRIVKNFTPIVKEAERIGATVAIEPVYVGTIYSPQCMKRLLDDMKSDNLAVILDVSNLIHQDTRHMQKEIINDAFNLFGDKIKAIHLKDFTFDGDKKSFAVAGTGELMIELIFERIKQLKAMPEIILDETSISLYQESLKSLEKVLG